MGMEDDEEAVAVRWEPNQTCIDCNWNRFMESSLFECLVRVGVLVYLTWKFDSIILLDHRTNKVENP